MEIEYPSLVRGLSNPEYQAMDDHISRSYLVRVMRYGGECQQRMDLGYSQFKGNAGTSLGSLFDTLVEGIIGGKSVGSILASPPPEALSKTGRRVGKEFDAWKEEVAKEGRISCTAEQEFQLTTMADSLMGCRPARELVEMTDETQLSGFFLWEGERCRVRPDGVTKNGWWDLKSTSSQWDRIHFSVWDYGYAEQEAMYVEAAVQLGWEHHRMPFVFTQTMEPFATRVFYLPEEVVESARARLINTLSEVRLRRKTGLYKPAEAEEISELEIPGWSVQKQQTEVFSG